MATTMRPDAAVSLDTRYQRLLAILHGCGSVCVGYSGGVDSVFLATVAVDVLGADNVLAVTGLSPAYPAVQRAMAADCAARFGIPHAEIDTHELSDVNYTANPANRCYYCKSELWPRLKRVAAERGLAAVLDGSNADDAGDYRPGFAAAREHGVLSPLLEAGLAKEEIRTLSLARGLPTWDQPSAPCLSSRLPYGVAVTPERLGQVERAETALRDLGYHEFRVRHHDDCARVELAPAELPRAWIDAARIHHALRRAGMARVLLDVEGYRRGALNEALVHLGAGSSLAGTSTVATPAARTEDMPSFESAGFHGDIAVLHARPLPDAQAAAPRLRALGFRYVAVDACG
ncbi:MAG: ATP-dependent sacrificial sulfur transferase LarE [Gemmatimonadota bacterium]